MKNFLYRMDLKGSPYLYIAPFFLVFAAFGLFPLVYTGWVSLHDWELISDDHTWVGFANYTKLFGDTYFWNALWNTLSIWVMSTIPQLLMALVLAHVLNQRLRAPTFWRMTALLPNITSVAAVALIFAQIFGRDYGLVNYLLGVFGLGHIDWQSGTASSQIAISAMIIWRWTGNNALIYLAAMQAVPRDLYAAASLDGASSFQQLTKITIPAIRPTILFTVIISTIGGMQVLAEPLLFGGASPTGGSDRQFQTLSLYLYEVGFSRFDFGYASTAAWAMFGIIVIAALINYLITSRLRRS
ncbi:cellobiose transport system permease protein [Allocatelliglobosispora scoriae]|uniref:Cellobiose transport system permease protein n=1 Tax=Allocatelliglobosispora scoriae TaxID=643052 RepID=A0A841BSC9_9ACTN|nr:sugar ABC transporter permease [Allocatelliglobosispora scoriae]MBB5869632.1 cellobiose transport system permease protein [Allocatelliglobosispora scoriae]